MLIPLDHELRQFINGTVLAAAFPFEISPVSCARSSPLSLTINFLLAIACPLPDAPGKAGISVRKQTQQLDLKGAGH